MKVLHIIKTDFGQVRVSDGTSACSSTTVEGALAKLAEKKKNEPPLEDLFKAAGVVETLWGDVKGASRVHTGLMSA